MERQQSVKAAVIEVVKRLDVCFLPGIPKLLIERDRFCVNDGTASLVASDILRKLIL